MREYVCQKLQIKGRMKRKVNPIIRDCNRLLMEEILKGFVFNIPYRLGKIFFTLSKRNFKKNKVDYKASLEIKRELESQGLHTKTKQHPDGEPWIVYYTNDTYIYISWVIKRAIFRNKTLYSFTPTDGLIEEAYRRLNNDKLMTLKLSQNGK